MNVADLDVHYLGSQARWRKPSCRYRDPFMALIGKDLPCPSPYATAHKNKARNADSRTCYQAREAKRDSEGKDNRPRCARGHLDRFSWALFRIPNTGHDSPPDKVHDCKHHDPHRIYEVPIKSNRAKTFTLSRVDPAEQRED